jgi:hypothetical protein
MLQKKARMYIPGMKNDVSNKACLGSAATLSITYLVQWAISGRKSPRIPATMTWPFVPYEPQDKVAIAERTEIPIATASRGLGVTLSNDIFTRWCDEIFDHGFEVIADLSLGKDGCPFVYARCHWQANLY